MDLDTQIEQLGGEYDTTKIYFGSLWRRQVTLRLPVLRPGIYIEIIYHSEYGAPLEETLSTAFSQVTEIIKTHLSVNNLDDALHCEWGN